MLTHHINRIRESFSAKITLLALCSVVVTSFVIGLASTRSTARFLAEKTGEKFPSILASTSSRVRTFYIGQFRDLERLSQTEVVRNYLSRRDNQSSDSKARHEVGQYFRYVHEEFPVYEELMMISPAGELIATSSGRADLLPVVNDYMMDSGTEARVSIAEFDSVGHNHQWLFVPIRFEGRLEAWTVARFDLESLTGVLREVGNKGDLYLLDPQGRFLTQPKSVPRNVLGARAMQVPTRDTLGPVLERRSNFAGSRVFQSKSHLEELGWWLVYEENYSDAMAPLLYAQRRIWMAVLLIALLASLAAYRIARSILSPIRELAVGARRINEGLVGVNIPRRYGDEVGLMIDTFNEMARQIAMSQAELQYKNKMLNGKNDELEGMNKRLEELSITDGLTGLFNHRHFWNLLNTELTRVNLYRGDLALVLVDLDDFKRVNDHYGHSVGDLLLLSVARILHENVRDSDIVARYGGEEFAILMPDADLGQRGADNVIEALRVAVEKLRFKVPDTDILLKVTVSVGVSMFRGNRRDFFNDADKALYRSKSEGKNRVRYSA